MDPTFPLVPIANFLACILILASLSKNMFHSRNVGVCSLAIWVVIMSFTTAVDSIIWADNVENVAPVWCDIVTRLGIGSNAALPAASFVIVRRLSNMLRQRNPVPVKLQKVDLLVDLSVCIGSPIIVITLYYIVQSARFLIMEELGCIDTVASAGLSILIISFVGIILPLLSLTLYSPRLIWIYFKHKELDALLASSSALDRRSFLKVLVLGLFDIFITLPLQVYDFVQVFLQGGVTTFWPGWEVVHSEISSVPTITTDVWKSAGPVLVSNVRLNQWINPLFAVMFFALFGLTKKNMLWYRNVFWKIMKPFGFKPRPVPVTSNIAFESGPVPGNGTSGAYGYTTTHQSSALGTADRGQSFDDAGEIEAARSFGAETMVVARSLQITP